MTINELTKEEVNKAILSLEQKISAVSNNAKNVYEPKQNFVVKPGSITSKELANGAVTSNKLANGTVTTDKIADSAIDASKIVDEAITAAKIENAAITGDKIGSEAITSDKIAEFAITAGLLADGSVNTDKLADNSISSDKIKDGNVSTAKIAAEAITTSLIASGAVNTAKLADDSITTDKINTGAITTAKIANDAISSDLIKAKAITGVKIEDRTIEAVKIAAGTITANEIKAGTITANEIKSGSLSIGVFNDIDKSTIESASPAAQKAIASAQAALASANAASSSADDASGYATSASGYADSASGYANAASSSADTASGYATNASNSADAASDSASEASGYASAANASADSASGYADTASSKATAASSSASAAKSSASTASSKATAASGYADAASSSASEASGYATSASGYATNASNSASAAKSSADTASSKATAASSSASAAKSSASTASSKASAAATSEANAATSEANAATSEANAASSASAAAASETEAKTQADYVRDFDKNWDTKVANTMINGQTLIVGGYLNTGIIETEAISADKIAVHTLTSAQMKVGNGVNLLSYGMDTFDQWDKIYSNAGYTGTISLNTNMSYVFSGKKSLKVTAKNNDNYVWIGSTNWKILLESGKNYVLSCYVKNGSSTNTAVQLYGFGYAAQTTGQTSYSKAYGKSLTLTDTTWKRMEVSFKAEANALWFAPRIDVDTNGNTAYFDAFQLEEVDAIQLEEVESVQGAGPFSPAGATIINGGNIITSTVDATQIKANAVTTDKIATGAVIADKIAAGAISASKLLVSDVNNLVDFNGTNDVFISDDFTISSDKTYLTRAAKRDTYLNKTIACKPGEKYYFSFDVKLNTAGSNQDRVLNFGVFNLASTWTAVATASGITTSWKSVSGVYTVPSGLTKFKPWIQQNLTEGFSTFDVRNVILYKQEKAVLIEDGTITASKISANTIVSSKMATETLNVLANSLVTNPTVSQSTRGWSQNSYVTWDSTEKAIKVARNGTGGPTFESDSFKVGPKDILKVRFRIKATGTFTANQGFYFGPKYNSSWYPIAWDATNRQWTKKERVSGNTSTNTYFINDFKTTTDYVLFETFILGNGYTVTENSKTYIDVTQLHSPITTGSINAIQCTSDNQVCTLRAGFNAGASGQAWYIKDIEVTPVNSGLITADQIIANSITADKINTNGLSVNTAYSSNFSNIPGSEAGFFFNGTGSSVTLQNGSVIPAQTEYHYGNAIYDSNYIKNSDYNLCIGFGKNAGYKARKKGTYSSTTTYNAGDVVIYSDNNSTKYYMSKSDSNKGNTPSGSSEKWVSLDSYDADSIAIGTNALSNNYYGKGNIAIGRNAHKLPINADNSVVIGTDAVSTQYADQTVAIGSNVCNKKRALNSVVVGAFAMQEGGAQDSVAIGWKALYKTTGNFNMGIGSCALINNTTGENNIAIGNSSLYAATTMSNNIAIGKNAMNNCNNSECENNIVIGNNSGVALKKFGNVIIGNDAFILADTASKNVVIGHGAGSKHKTGGGNILIGAGTQTSAEDSYNEINIGNTFKKDDTGIFLDNAQIRFRSNLYGDNAVLNLQNSDIKGLNSLIWNDSASIGEGLFFPRTDEKYDALRLSNSYIYVDTGAAPNVETSSNTWQVAYCDESIYQLGGNNTTQYKKIGGAGRIWYSSVPLSSNATMNSVTFTYKSVSSGTYYHSVNANVLVVNDGAVQAYKSGSTIGTKSYLWLLAELY